MTTVPQRFALAYTPGSPPARRYGIDPSPARFATREHAERIRAFLAHAEDVVVVELPAPRKRNR